MKKLKALEIVSFGKNWWVESHEELRAALLRYRGKSIAIHYFRESGVKGIEFWDVSDEGIPSESYGNNQAIDLDDFLAEIGWQHAVNGM